MQINQANAFLAMYRKLSGSFIRTTMAAQHLSKCYVHLAGGQHTLRAVVGLPAGARAVAAPRSFAQYRPSAQLQFNRGLLSRNALRSSLSAKAEESEISEAIPVKVEGEKISEAADSDHATPVSTRQEEFDQQEPFPGVQSSSGIEVVSEAIPTEAVLSAVVTKTNSAVADADARSSAAGPGEWETVFQGFLDTVSQGEHFEGRAPAASSFSVGILKRGLLNFARSRQDILFSLPAEKIQAVLAAGPPYTERKVCCWQLLKA